MQKPDSPGAAPALAAPTTAPNATSDPNWFQFHWGPGVNAQLAVYDTAAEPAPVPAPTAMLIPAAAHMPVLKSGLNLKSAE